MKKILAIALSFFMFQILHSPVFGMDGKDPQEQGRQGVGAHNSSLQNLTTHVSAVAATFPTDAQQEEENFQLFKKRNLLCVTNQLLNFDINNCFNKLNHQVAYFHHFENSNLIFRISFTFVLID